MKIDENCVADNVQGNAYSLADKSWTDINYI